MAVSYKHEIIFSSDNNQPPNYIKPYVEEKDLIYKILMVGDSAVGKTSIIKRYVHNVFTSVSKPTIGVDFALKHLEWDDNTNVKLQLWDISGQERFSNMTRVYYKEAVGAFVVFDVTRYNTFESIQKWKLDLDKKVFLPNSETPIPTILLANKIDLLDDKETEEYQDTLRNNMDKYCTDNGFVAWFEISAKNNTNIESAITKLVTEILEKVNIDDTFTLHKSIVISDPIKSQGCCG